MGVLTLANRECQGDAGFEQRFEENLLQCPLFHSPYVNPVSHTFAKPRDSRPCSSAGFGFHGSLLNM